MKRILLPILAVIVLPTSANGGDFIVHGGRLNHEFCHNGIKNDNYHCDRSNRGENSNNSKKINIDNCYDGDTCTSTQGEKIRLACINTSELRGAKANPVQAKEARDYINILIAGKDVDIRRVTKDKYGRTVAELSMNEINVQRIMVTKGYAKIYSKYAYQCPWTR